MTRPAPPQEGGCPNVLPAPWQVPEGEGGCTGASLLLGFTVVPAVSERRLLGAEGDKPGLSATAGGLASPLSGA